MATDISAHYGRGDLLGRLIPLLDAATPDMHLRYHGIESNGCSHGREARAREGELLELLEVDQAPPPLTIRRMTA